MKKMAIIRLVMLALLVLLGTVSASAKTLILEGGLDGAIAMRQSMEFAVNRGNVSTFTFKFALPANFSSRTVNQSVNGLDLAITPRPASSVVETDRFGNRFQLVTWSNITQDVRVNLAYNIKVATRVSAMESKTAFPLGSIASTESLYLQPTALVQSESPAVVSQARSLTANAKTQYDAVTVITNWVADNIKYTFNPPQYDAAYTLSTRSGNCQNLAHLAIALLRSSGIPARIVGGITLKDSWKVPVGGKNSIVQSMGQGGHAWLEVWFPDLGWLPYDPQQSRQFTSSRHIKQSHGLDSKDINDTWRGAPYLPAYSELIDGRFNTDNINLKMKSSDVSPRPYVLSNAVTIAGVVASPKVPVTTPTLPEVKVAATPKKPSIQPQGSGAGPAETRFVTDEEPPPVAAKPAIPAIKPTLPPPAIAKPETKLPIIAKPEVKPPQITRPEPRPAPVIKPAPIPPLVVAKPVVKPAPVVGKPEPKPVLAPPAVVPQPVLPVADKPQPGSLLAFGNMEFPNMVNLYDVKGDTGTRVFERETSEYVTSRYIYAQAVQVKNQMSLDRISLAMRKFGGDGSIYIDLVKDKAGRPDIMQGIRSNLVDLEKITRKPGYYWVDFSFPPDNLKPQQLEPGKYWIVLRASGEAIMNWFYIPGKPYSDSDDTRSTAKGFRWEDILNYDFVFKVSGKVL